MSDKKLRKNLLECVRRAAMEGKEAKEWYRKRLCREQFIPQSDDNRARRKKMKILNSVFRQLASEGILNHSRDRNFFYASDGHFEPKYWGIR